MKTILTFGKKVTALAFIILCGFMQAQTVHTVDNNGANAADFDNIADAIAAAADGDIIYVQQSAINYGSIFITKPLTLIGRSHKEDNYKTTLGNINIQSSDVVVKGFNLTGYIVMQAAGNTPISNIDVNECWVASYISIGYNYPVSDVEIKGNFIAGGFYQYSNATNTIVTNNWISGQMRTYNPDTFYFSQNIGWENQLYNYGDANSVMNISNSIFITNSYNQSIETSGKYKMQNCITYNYRPGYGYTFQGSTNPANVLENVQLNVDPLFVEWTNNAATANLQLQGGSPAVGAGLNGEDLGVYQDYPFNALGNPVGYPTVTIDSAPSSVPAGSDLTITVSAEAH